MIAALFVETNGVYFGLPDVDPWDAKRDARLYAGPHPVVAHPPCSRWCRLAGLVQKRWGYKKGDDGGCFASALAAVRLWGGVLEHPAWSEAFLAFGLGEPERRGGWQRTLCGGWTCAVEQFRYGHPARKATWLYAHGVGTPPELRWGANAAATRCISTSRRRVPDELPEMKKSERSRTPTEFRDELIRIAKSSRSAEVESA